MVIAITTILFSLNVFAAPTAAEVINEIQKIVLKQSSERAGNWVVGDQNNYNMDMGFIQGTMEMSVKSIEADGSIWLLQNANLGFLGAQVIETNIDPATGQVKKMLVNGQEQTPPTLNVELIEVVDATITVPAGTFDCQHIRMLNKDDNKEINIWSSGAVPLSGMVKTVQPTQFGTSTIELTSFHKN